MSKFKDKQFWVDAGDRAITSLAQGLLGSGLLEQSGIINLDFKQILSLSVSYAVISVLTSISFRGRGEDVPPVGQAIPAATGSAMSIDSKILSDVAGSEGQLMVADSVDELGTVSEWIDGASHSGSPGRHAA